MRFTLVFSLILSLHLSAADPCSEKAQWSIPGQYVDQLHTTLNLSPSQALAIAAIQESFYTPFEERSQTLQFYRTQLFQNFQTAADDGVISNEEKNQLKDQRRTILDLVILQKGLIQSTSELIKDQLTTVQVESLSNFKADLEIPQASLEESQAVLDTLQQLLEGYALTGFLNPIHLKALKDNLQMFQETVYIPNWLESKVLYWRKQIESSDFEKLLQALVNRMDAAKIGMLLRTLQGLDKNSLSRLQDLPIYRILIQDLAIDIALVSPLFHCKITGNSTFSP